MTTPPALWQAAQDEMEQYAFTADPALQPAWDVPEKVAINVAVAGLYVDGGFVNEHGGGEK